MHIKKNVYENILNILLDIDNKSKDNLTVCFDLQTKRIQKELCHMEKQH